MEADIRCAIALRFKRLAGIVIGCLIQVLFVFTVWRMFCFLKDGGPPSTTTSLAWDACLAIQFAAPHSLLLLPSVKKCLGKIISPAFYGLMFCAVTCGSLLLLIECWEGDNRIVWKVEGPLRWAVIAGFFASWVALYYSINLTGLGYQTGLTPWSYWLRGKPVPWRKFTPRGAYRVLRHPVYLSFAGLIWFTPTMTMDHAVLTVIWTAYLLFGSWLKDRRLTHYLGASYRTYAATVPGYPLMPVGPLARLSSEILDCSGPSVSRQAG